MAIVKNIAKYRHGIDREQLLKNVKLSSGGTFNKRIEELEAAGFIQRFMIDKSYAKNLANKLRIFEEQLKNKKQVFLTLITTMGIKKNIWSEDLVHSEITLKDLMSPNL